MKIGLLTFQQSNNYGAILQSYALYKTVKDYKHDVEVINYQCDYISKPYKLVNLKKKGLLSYLFGVIGYICYMPRRRKCKEFRKLISYSEKVDKSNIKMLSNKYDKFIAGSDQIWNYKLTNSDYNYLLEFIDDPKKKYSYAASFGLREVDKVETDKYKLLLSQFNKILVREENGLNIVNKLTKKNANVSLDPTLLLTKEDWLQVAKTYKSDEDYILVYQLGISKKMVDFADKLAKIHNLKVIYIPFPLGKFIKCKINLTCGPSEWLGLFNGAKYVITDSFHGTVFSIIFNKDFFSEICIQNSGVGVRIENLLNKFNLNDRLIINGENKKYRESIDYGKVNNLLEMERLKSIKLLEEIICEIYNGG